MVYTYHLYESTFSSQQSLRVSMCPETKMFENHCSKKRIYQKYLLVLEHTHTHTHTIEITLETLYMVCTTKTNILGKTCFSEDIRC